MKAPGVYVLYAADGSCLYVGSSVNMERRVKVQAQVKAFTRVEYLPCSVASLREAEDEAIVRLRPALNKNCAGGRRGESSVKTRTISLTINLQDEVLLQRLQRKLAKIGHTAIFRLALRALDRELEEKR